MPETPLPDELDPLSDLVMAFDHFAFAVHDLAAVAGFFESLGGSFHRGGDNRRMGFRWLQYHLPGGGKVEALSPVAEDCFLHGFLSDRGEGIHHITFRVSDVEEAAARAEATGLRVVGLFTDLRTWKECFIHPKDAYGTVVQLAQWTDKERDPVTLEQVLAGEVFTVV